MGQEKEIKCPSKWKGIGESGGDYPASVNLPRTIGMYKNC